MIRYHPHLFHDNVSIYKVGKAWKELFQLRELLPSGNFSSSLLLLASLQSLQKLSFYNHHHHHHQHHHILIQTRVDQWCHLAPPCQEWSVPCQTHHRRNCHYHHCNHHNGCIHTITTIMQNTDIYDKQFDER